MLVPLTNLKDQAVIWDEDGSVLSEAISKALQHKST